MPLLDSAQSGHGSDTYRRVVVIAGKTVVYALVAIALGIGERIFEAFLKPRELKQRHRLPHCKVNIDRFCGFVLLISLVVATHLGSLPSFSSMVSTFTNSKSGLDHP